MIYFSDVDVLTKLASCGFLPDLPEFLGVAPNQFDARHLASLRARAKKLEKNIGQALIDFCDSHSEVDGDSNASRQQQLIDAGLDGGEALLFAEAEAAGGIVVTGDKRAIERYFIVSTEQQRDKLKVVCWEQLLLRVNECRGYEYFSQGCCRDAQTDGVLRLAFNNGPATPEPEAIEAINSYLNGLVRKVGDLLLDFSHHQNR